MVCQLTVIANHPDAVALHEGGVESPRVTSGRDISERVIPQNQCLVTRRLQEIGDSGLLFRGGLRHLDEEPGLQAQCRGA